MNSVNIKRKTIYQSQPCCKCALHTLSTEGGSKVMSQSSVINFTVLRKCMYIHPTHIRINKSLLATIPPPHLFWFFLQFLNIYSYLISEMFLLFLNYLPSFCFFCCTTYLLCLFWKDLFFPYAFFLIYSSFFPSILSNINVLHAVFSFICFNLNFHTFLEIHLSHHFTYILLFFPPNKK